MADRHEHEVPSLQSSTNDPPSSRSLVFFMTSLFLYHSLCLLSVIDDSDDPDEDTELWQVLPVPVQYLIKRVKCNIEINS